MVIAFGGSWKLVPTDRTNWELYHRHATVRGKDAGEVKWHRLGRYYQASTFAGALEFAADCEMRERHEDAALDIRDALSEYRQIVRALEDDLLKAWAAMP